MMVWLRVALWVASWWVGSCARRSKHGAQVAQYVRDRRTAAHLEASALSSLPAAPAASGKRLVIYRTHVADPLTVRILGTLADSLAGAKDYVLCVLYDSDVLAEAPRLYGNFSGGAHFVGVGLEAMLRRYARISPRKAIVKSHYQQLAYALAVRQLGGDFDFVWCVEHDVALTGGRWREMLEDHDAGDPRDLLAWRVGWTPKIDKVHGGGSWNANACFGPAFSRMRMPDDTAFLFGSIVRYSGRFAAHLDAMAAAPAPSYGHSETATPSLCNVTKWCTMGNLSSAWVGLNEYQLPKAVSSDVFDALADLAPDRIFHPVRDTGSASNKDNVLNAGSSFRVSKTSKQTAAYTAMCLLKNPRPPRPSYDCPIGCPHHLQRTCPVVNCIWGDDRAKYVHMAVSDCLSKCQRNPAGCPYDTAYGYVKDDGHNPF